MKIATSEEMRETDRITIEERGISGAKLMDEAGASAADFIREKYPSGAAVIVTGKGNNAGDGFVVARYLFEKGYQTTLLMLCGEEQLQADAILHYKNIPAGVIKKVAQTYDECRPFLKDCDFIVDAILGTGVKGEVKGFWGEVIALINSSGKKVFSIDIPSGLPGNGDKVSGSVIKADYTITMGLLKVGMAIYPGIDLSGEIKIAPLSFPKDLLMSKTLKYTLLEAGDIKGFFPDRKADGNKRTFGYVFIAAGSEGMTGASILSARAATRSGAGLVYIGIPQKLMPVVEAHLIEPVKIAMPCRKGIHFDWESFDKLLHACDKADAVLIGPGIGQHFDTSDMICGLLSKIKKTLVLDADGLNAIQNNPDILVRRAAPTIITPHPGEMARLMKTTAQEIQEERLRFAEQFASQYNAIVVLKGARTVIAGPNGKVCINPTGNTALAKGGSGDVLAGLIAGFAAQGLAPFDAACAGAFIHGLAADIALKTADVKFITPSDIIERLNDAYRVIF